MIAQIKIRRGTTAEWAAASPVVLAAGEPGWDSTLKGMKVGDGSTEWAALPWIDAKNRPDINADTLDGVHLSDIRLGQNILHNWDFRNPVNQRGLSGTVSSGYVYDRWSLDVGYVVLSSDGISKLLYFPPSTSQISQYIEGTHLSGKTVTFSALSNDGTIRTVTGIVPTSGTDVYLNMFKGYVGLGLRGDRILIFFSNEGNELAFRAFKLELGTVSTLHLDPPVDYGVELAKCQRYCLKVDGYVARSLEYHSTGTRFLIPTPVTMRVTPSLASGSLQWWSTSSVQIPVTSMQISLSNFGVLITLNTTSAGVDGQLVASNAILSADL